MNRADRAAISDNLWAATTRLVGKLDGRRREHVRMLELIRELEWRLKPCELRLLVEFMNAVKGLKR